MCIRDSIETLQQDFPVWISDIVTLEESLEMIQKVGQLTHKEPEAFNICQQLSTQFSSLQSSSRRPRVAYFIWKKPYMVAANGTFIHDMLRKAGFLNVFEDLTRYPEISEADLQQAAPELIFLSSEPYSFREKHLLEFQEICPSAHIMLVDGELFSWYGSRLLKSVAYFNAVSYTHLDVYKRQIGTPFITNQEDTNRPEEQNTNDMANNNRVLVYHLGFEGNIGPSIQFLSKISYSANYGTYIYPYPTVPKQLSALLQLKGQIAALSGLEWVASAAIDRGDLYTKNTGFKIGFRQTFGTCLLYTSISSFLALCESIQFNSKTTTFYFCHTNTPKC